MSDQKELVERLRAHVQDRGGLSRDAETGEIVLPNGAWAMMLEAASLLEAQVADPARVRQECEETCNSYVAENQRLHDRATTAEATIASLREDVGKRVAEEREACAKLCDRRRKKDAEFESGRNSYAHFSSLTARDLAAAIRARALSNEETK